MTISSDSPPQARSALRVLFVEDNPDDVALAIRQLTKTGYDVTCDVVVTPEAVAQQVCSTTYDVVLADYRMPRCTGMDAFEVLKRLGKDIPFILVTGALGDENAVECLKMGVSDYILKDRLARLPTAIGRALEERRTREAQRRAEESIVQLNRLYAVLSEVNHALERIREQDLLLQEVCRIAVELGSFRMAWIGLVESGTGLLKPVAHYGVKEDYLEHIRSSVSDGLDGRGPTGTALREGRHFICDDIESDPRMLPWRDEALQRQYRSAAAFSIQVQSRTFGVITLYAARPGFFDEENVKLLDRMAADVSFALESMERERQRRQAEDDLRESRDQLRQLAARLESIREEERTRLAREVHDELGQMLTVLKMDLETLGQRYSQPGRNGSEALQRVQNMSEHLDSSIKSVQRISAELRPGVLDHLGLAAAIQWQAQEFQKRAGIRCVIAELHEPAGLHRDHSTAVFRIFQEVLTNIARHAHATVVRIGLRAQGKQLLLEVSDNGRGIEPSRITDPNSLGLLGMRERAHILGGSVKFTAALDKGTTVTLTIPINQIQRRARPREISVRAAPKALETSSDATALRILLADDDALFRQSLKELLAARFSGAIYGEAKDGRQAMKLARAQNWDVLLLDISMPGSSGLTVLKSLRRMGSKIPVLVLSMHAEGEYGRSAREAGASGYVNKSSATTELIAAINVVLAGGTYFAGQGRNDGPAHSASGDSKRQHACNSVG